MTDQPPAPSILTTTDPDAIAELFKADPSTLDHAALTRLTIELRRRRSQFASEEAAKQVAPKATRPKAPALPAAEAAALDKPVAETNLEDFL
jgi:hypothetical protein